MRIKLGGWGHVGVRRDPKTGALLAGRQAEGWGVQCRAQCRVPGHLPGTEGQGSDR